MRVIAGKYRSRTLKAVEGKNTRPTTDKNKENLFNVIGPYFQGGVCLDLFGGSGALGIEALSRGMDELYVVDRQYKAYATIQENLKNLHIDHAHVYKMDYRKALSMFEDDVKFDLVLLDPPYGMKINRQIVTELADAHHLNKDALIVVEDLASERCEFPADFEIVRELVYGITIFQILRYRGGE